jgi:hypothetical protein
MSEIADIEEYIKRLEVHTKNKLAKLEQAIEKEFRCKAYWDPVDQNYRFVNGSGRKHQHYRKLN